jgi:hypothetical protein
MQSRASDCDRFRVAGLFSSSFAQAQLIRASLILLVAGGATLLLTGCGPRRVRADFTHYENSYAVTSNREELLNLARLEQHDPTYFFKLGQISSSYRMEAALTGTGQVSTVANPPASVIPTGGGSPTFLYENDPSFTMIPVSDEANANILLKPVDSTIFYSLYVQGWRLDQLLRLAVNRVELTLPVPLDSLPPTDPKHKTGCKVEVIRNLPPPWFDSKGDYTNDGPALASYITFLRVSAVIYALQKHGLLLLRGTNTFEPLDRASYIPNPGANNVDKDKAPKTTTGTTATAQANVGNTPVSVSVNIPGSQPSGGDSAPKNGSAPLAKDINDAAAKNEAWELQGADSNGAGGKWVLGTNTLEPQFQLTAHPDEESADAAYIAEDPKSYGQNVEAIRELLEKDFEQQGNGMTQLMNGPDLTEILEMLYNGFSIEESSTDQDSEKKLCDGSKSNRISAHLVMRSLIGLMAAAAQEQRSFETMMEKPYSVPQDSAATIMEFYSAVHLATTNNPPSQDEIAAKMATLAPLANAPLSAVIPNIEQLPVLKLTWKDGRPPDEMQLYELGMTVKYRGQDYIIADSQQGSAGAEVPANTYWNRDMFRLINELASQVSIDPSKFPLPEVLQLRTE